MTDIGPSYDELARMPARDMSMGLALSWQAARDPHRPALTMGDISYSRIELDRIANRHARFLASMGLGKDDRVAILLPTGPLHQIMSFAVWKLGATAIPLPAKLVDHELQVLLQAANPALVIGIEDGRLPGWRAIPADFQIDPSLSDAPLPESVSTCWKAITSGGSTGIPKLLWEERHSLIHPLKPMEMLMFKVDDVILHPATAHHNSPFCQTNWALCWGAHVILMQRFDALEWLRQVELHRPRWAYLVPTMMSRILNIEPEVRAGFDLSSLEVVMHMAAPCPPWVKSGWIEWLGAERIFEIYGGTEGYGGTVLTGPEWVAHPGTVGKAPPDTQVRDEAGKVLPPGEIGLVYLLPPKGNFLDLPSEYRTYGDMGWLDEDGYLYLADRRTDMIVCGGGNIYPAEIEAAIEQFPGVVASAVIGLPDADMGAVPHAIVEMAAGVSPPAPTELAKFLETRLTRAKHPRSVEFTTNPLKDWAGKMRRSRLREERLAKPGFAFEKMA